LLLLFLLLCKGLLKLDLLVFEELGGLIAHGMATLLPEVDELVESDQAALLLLGQVVSGSGSARAHWAKHDHVEFLLFFESRWHLDLELICEHLSKLAFKLTLHISEHIASLRDLLLCLSWLFELRPVIAFLILRISLAVLLSLIVLIDLLLDSVVLFELFLKLLDFCLKLFHLALLVVLLLDLRPEFATRLAQR
jgi:hypothetical protein